VPEVTLCLCKRPRKGYRVTSGNDCGAQNPEREALSPASAINTFPVPDFNYVDDELVVLDRVDDAVWSLPDPVALRPG
jgi:hypothetical protein